MQKEKKSFFERLTGSVRVDDNPRYTRNSNVKNYSDDEDTVEEVDSPDNASWEENDDADLAIDMYQTSDSIIIKAFIANVHPDNLDVNIGREIVTIKGDRKPERIPKDEDVFVQELYWGSFSRTVTLPQEISVEDSTAEHKQGTLTITMPKLDKKKQMRVKVKSA